MALNKTEVKRDVRSMVADLRRRASTHEEWSDGVFEAVDEWWSAKLGTGRISEMSPVPEDERDVDYLRSAAVILQVAIEEGWGIADDSGLWEGLAPFPALLSQAFFTVEQAVAQQEPRRLE